MKLLIRFLSLIICVCLIAGGAYLAYTETMKNEEMFADWDAVMNTPFIPGTEETQPEGDEQTPEGDEQTPEGGEQTPEGDEQTPEGNEQTPEGDEQTPGGNEPLPDGSGE